MFKVKPIYPKMEALNSVNYKEAVQRVFDKVADKMLADFRKTVRGWKKKPEFRIDDRKPNRLIVTSDKVYRFVSKGTRVRYAIMTKDFISKTNPGMAVSGPGQGRVVFVSRKHPMPGIKAREFEIKIAMKWRPEIQKMVQKEIKKVARQAMKKG